MNAPVNLTGSLAASAHATGKRAVLLGVARHVTADGCQFALVGSRPSAGTRLACKLSGNAPVIGTVRWIVEDRVGFAFDQPLDAASLADLGSHCLQVKAIELVAAGGLTVPR
ncbi:hypothetical protein [Novosphingobium sp. 9U]|uniref:hypothetical protein n=1 Tax=Novosphingobium sp. 9U TaxID=2653158 RepID=UPI0012F33A09|nr:hypothetical protein [Novosphingobium sp. 9U]VWX52233.1 hypothetical protein NOVOSPHI9U_40703 [Novosphingobium sp. 9U]